MKNSQFLHEELLETIPEQSSDLFIFHPYEGLEDNRGSLARYPYHKGVSAYDLCNYVKLGGKLDSMGHYGITLDNLAALLKETEGKGIFEDAVKFMVHEETPKWVNWSDAFYRAYNMAKLATTPTEFCKLCYQTKGFTINSLTQGKFIYRLSNTEKRALRYHRLANKTITEQVAFIVKFRKDSIRWMSPIDAWKALGLQIPPEAISYEDGYVLHPYGYEKALRKISEGLRLADAEAAGFCLEGVKTFLEKKMPFVYFLIRNANEWSKIPSDILKSRYLIHPRVWEGYDSYRTILIIYLSQEDDRY